MNLESLPNAPRKIDQSDLTGFELEILEYNKAKKNLEERRDKLAEHAEYFNNLVKQNLNNGCQMTSVQIDRTTKLITEAEKIFSDKNNAVDKTNKQTEK